MRKHVLVMWCRVFRFVVRGAQVAFSHTGQGWCVARCAFPRTRQGCFFACPTFCPTKMAKHIDKKLEFSKFHVFVQLNRENT